MKTTAYLFLFLGVFVSTLFTSCTENEQIAPKVEQEIAPVEFKENVDRTISDNKGNEVVLRISSNDLSMIEEYLKYTEISLITNSDIAELPANPASEEIQDPITQNTEVEEVPNLNFEVVSSKIGDHVENYRLDFTAKDRIPSDLGNSRYYYSSSFTSGGYIEGFKFYYYNSYCSNCKTEMEVKHYNRKTRVSSYRFHASRKLNAGQSWWSCKDGRRTKVYINTWRSLINYNYSLQFWNCS